MTQSFQPMVVRAARGSDLDALMDLARQAGIGVTSLPVNAERLGARLAAAERAFSGSASRDEADYLFVLVGEDDRAVGICGLIAAVGKREPWYNYRVGLSVFSSPELGHHREVPTLFLANDLTGTTELCSLFLAPKARGGCHGRLLSRSRLLFLAEFPERFATKVIAEMRGVSDSDGNSPFWEALGRRFFKMPFAEADYLTGLGNKAFVAELMPKFPLYSCFLPEAARAVIGKVHPATEPALALLKTEGFRYDGYVDIFDAGPVIACDLDRIRAVHDSQLLRIAEANADDAGEGPLWLIHNRELANCRITAAPARLVDGDLEVAAAVIAALQLRPGAIVRAVPLAAPAAPVAELPCGERP